MTEAASAADDRWHCPDCRAWVRADVDAHYCNAPVVITIPVYQPPYQWYPTVTPYIYPTVYPYQQYPYRITCGTISAAD